MKNFFEIFALPQSFALDLDDLEKKHLAFQQQFHPDNSSSADIEQSILINEAYKILSAPISRASYILGLNGIDLENDSQAPKVDQATLFEILELQEGLAEMDASAAENLKKELNTKIKSLLAEVALELENKDFRKAAQILIKAKYFDKTLRDLKAKKRN
jgi:molecular chaperone HscB